VTDQIESVSQLSCKSSVANDPSDDLSIAEKSSVSDSRPRTPVNLKLQRVAGVPVESDVDDIQSSAHGNEPAVSEKGWTPPHLRSSPRSTEDRQGDACTSTIESISTATTILKMRDEMRESGRTLFNSWDSSGKRHSVAKIKGGVYDFSSIMDWLDTESAYTSVSKQPDRSVSPVSKNSREVSILTYTAPN
jgi:hypothetical protein